MKTFIFDVMLNGRFVCKLKYNAVQVVDRFINRMLGV